MFNPFLILKKIKFVLVTWALSRVLIFTIMFLVIPIFFPKILNDISSLAVLTRWDGLWYKQIATSGYHYVADGKSYPVAFFPLFPIITRAVMTFGLPFALAGTLVSNLAFLGALIVIYQWVEETYGSTSAKWTIAVLAWCPLSLYAAVTYTEGLFLLLSSLALKAFERGRYRQAALWGALTTATRVTGIMLVPTFLIVAWRSKRPWVAYGTALFVSLGFLLYSGYCGIRFGDPLIFIHIEPTFGQRTAGGFDWLHWALNFMYGVVGRFDWHNGTLKNLLHPVQVVLIGVSGISLWKNRIRLQSKWFSILATGLLLWWWILWGDGFLKVWMVCGGGYLFWCFRRQLTLTVFVYGICSLLLILFSGGVGSTDRYIYGTVSWSILVGLFLTRYQPWGLPILIYGGIVLGIFAGQFALNKWIS